MRCRIAWPFHCLRAVTTCGLLWLPWVFGLVILSTANSKGALVDFEIKSADGIKMKNERIVFRGRLLEMPSEAPRCGDIKVAVAYQFRVEKLIKGTFKEKSAVVLIACPDLKGDKFFEVKSVYQVEAISDLHEAGSYTIYNDYAGRPLLWGINITKLQQKRK